MSISKHLYTFDDFLFEASDLTYFIISPELKEILKTIDIPIAKRLLNDSSSDLSKKVSLLDIDEEQIDKWNFVNSVKVNQYLIDLNFETAPRSVVVQHQKYIRDKYKSLAKIGRIINKIYPNEYKPTDIEKLVNEYKMHFQTKFDFIDIVKGKDINKWYDCRNYNDIGGSELSNSCMSSDEKNHFMDFYAVNDDKISMVILYSDVGKNKIDARAILWKPDKIDGNSNKDGSLFMDRIYYNNQENKNLLQNYAKSNKWYYKNENSSSMSAEIIKPDNTKSQVLFELENVKIPENKKFPYADTLGILNLKTNTLSNDENTGEKVGWLSSTGGGLDGARWIERYDKFVHSTDLMKVTGKSGIEYVLKEDASMLPIYNKWFSDEYIESKEIVKVTRPQDGSDGKDYLVFKDDVEHCDSDDKDYYKYDVVYSEFLGDFIPKFNSKYVENMDSYMPTEDVNKVTVGWDYRWDGDNKKFNYIHPFHGWYHIDDPREPFFEYKGEYYLNDLKKEHPDFFGEKTKESNEKS